MIKCLLFNTMTKELSEAFLYATFASKLLNDLVQSFGMSSGPLVYQLQHDIANMK